MRMAVSVIALVLASASPQAHANAQTVDPRVDAFRSICVDHKGKFEMILLQAGKEDWREVANRDEPDLSGSPKIRRTFRKKLDGRSVDLLVKESPAPSTVACQVIEYDTKNPIDPQLVVPWLGQPSKLSRTLTFWFESIPGATVFHAPGPLDDDGQGNTTLGILSSTVSFNLPAAGAEKPQNPFMLGRRICSKALESFVGAGAVASRSEMDEFDGRRFGFSFAFLSKDKKLLVLARGKSASASAAVKCSFITRRDDEIKGHVASTILGPAEKNQKCDYIAIKSPVRPDASERQAALSALGPRFEGNNMTCIRTE